MKKQFYACCIAKHLLLFTALISGSVSVLAQGSTVLNMPEPLWAQYFGTTGYDRCDDIVTDVHGNVYITGCVSDEMGINDSVFLNSFMGGEYDAFVSKLNPDGIILWSYFIGGPADDLGTTITMTHEGDIVVAGNTSSETGLALNMEASFYSGGTHDMFCCRFNPNGEMLWSRYIGGEGNDITTSALSAQDGRILLTGSTNSESLNDPEYFIQENYGGGESDGLVVALDPMGYFLWSACLGGTEEDIINDVEVNSNGDLVVCGTGGEIPAISQVAGIGYAGGSADGFVARIDAEMQILWSRYIGGMAADAAEALTLDRHDNAIVVGHGRSGWIEGFDNDEFVFPEEGESYIAAFDENGEMQWNHHFGGSQEEWATDVYSDFVGNIYFNGHTTSLDMITINPFQSQCNGQVDQFVTKWDTLGQLIWSTYMGGTEDDFATALHVDRFGKILQSTASYSENMAEGGICNGGCDAFFSRLSECDNPYLTIDAITDSIVCDGGSVAFCSGGVDHISWVTGDTSTVINVNQTMEVYAIGHIVEGCYSMSERIPVVVLEKPEVTLEALGDTLFCGEGEGVWLHCSGADYYEWENGSLGDSLFVTETDTVFVTGFFMNECEDKSRSIVVRFVEMPDVVMAAAEEEVCIDGDPVPLIALPFGGQFIGPGIEDGLFYPLEAGGGVHTIFYSITDEWGCAAYSPMVPIEVFAVPTVIFASDDSLCYDDAPIELMGSPSGGWFTGDGMEGSIFNPSASGTGPQNIVYSYLDGHGCTNVDNQVIWVYSCVETAVEESVLQDILVFPNPASDIVQVRSSSTDVVNAAVFDSSGRLVHTFNFNGVTTFNCDHLAEGSYYIRFESKTESRSLPLIVKH